MSMSSHDVFLSFRGEDTRYNFTSHLYAALSRKGIKTYVDVDSLKPGEDISTALLRAIEDAKISLVVFSENYAHSVWCLDELMHILKCSKERGQIVIPIFHGIDPSDVRRQRGSYGYAFNAHEKRFVDKMDKVSQWRAALSAAANLAGWNSQDWREAEVIENIAEDVAKKLLAMGDPVDLLSGINEFMGSQYKKIKSEDSSSQKFESNIQLFEKIESTSNQPEENDSSNRQHEENDSVNSQPEENDSANSQPEENDSTNSQPEENDSVNIQPEENDSANRQPEENDSANNQPEENDSSNNQPEEIKYRGRFLKEIVALLAGFAGLILLTQSSYKRLFHDSKTSELLFFGIVSALLIFLVSMAPNYHNVLHKIRNLSFSKKLIIEFLFMVIVWMLNFLIKHPQFHVRAKDKSSCVLRNNERKSQQGTQYTLFSVGAFAVLAVLLSSEAEQTMELGFFSILIGLIMDTSMEIRTPEDGPNVWYILGSAVSCILLISFKHSSAIRRRLGDVLRNILVFFSALAGILFLFFSPFSKQQFEDSTDLKGAFFITFSFLLGFLLLKAQEFIDVLVKECHKHYPVKAIVRTLLFSFLSMIMFLKKYPRFKLHSEPKESCKEQNGQELKFGRNKYDVLTTMLFSFSAVIMSFGLERQVNLDIFNFLLELTMDSSIEILGNDEPNFLYLGISSMYCAFSIPMKSYLESLVVEKKDGSVLQHGRYQDQQEVPNARDRSFGDDQPLNESNMVEENGHAIGDIEMGVVKVNGTAIAIDTSSVIREDTDKHKGDTTPARNTSRITKRRPKTIDVITL